jgi:uncharacterized integral membrane protein
VKARSLEILLGCIEGAALLIYYGAQTSWYWPLLLLLGGSVIGGLLFGVVDNLAGLLRQYRNIGSRRQ